MSSYIELPDNCFFDGNIELFAEQVKFISKEYDDDNVLTKPFTPVEKKY
jgi:hypothetical protein